MHKRLLFLILLHLASSLKWLILATRQDLEFHFGQREPWWLFFKLALVCSGIQIPDFLWIQTVGGGLEAYCVVVGG